MAQQKPKGQSRPVRNIEGITRITVGGFKSISNDQSIEIRPLTILAGANSSGKSSIMQPLLLLKQTLEATYDPGALLLNGPNVKFTSLDQILSHTSNLKVARSFHVGVEAEATTTMTAYFRKSKSKELDIEQTIYDSDQGRYRLYTGMSQDEIQAALPASFKANLMALLDLAELKPHIIVTRNRCFLTLAARFETGITLSTPLHNEAVVGEYIRQMIHLPGLRGNPERTYPVTALGSEFPGTFENYVASVIRRWQTEGNEDALNKLNQDLFRLGLTGKVVAKSIDDTQVELLVNRFLQANKSNTEDMVSIVDVGLGMSQILSVVVALHAGKQGQLIYLVEPEIYLHPRAQSVMAEILADAVLAGKRLVIETHSSLLLLSIQTLIAEKKLPPEMVKLHWFKLLDDGSTQITSADLDKTGAFGDWPEDFANVELNLQSRYLDAAEDRLREK